MAVLKFEVLKLNCEPTEFSFVSNGLQCILRLMCYATCMKPNCTNITDTGVFHEIIINAMFVRLQKDFFFFKYSLQGSLDIMLFCICRSRPFHTYSEQRYCSEKKRKRKRKRIKFIISFSNIIQKKLSYHFRSTPNYVFFMAGINLEKV